jgi:hypothetical protein
MWVFFLEIFIENSQGKISRKKRYSSRIEGGKRIAVS